MNSKAVALFLSLGVATSTIACAPLPGAGGGEEGGETPKATEGGEEGGQTSESVKENDSEGGEEGEENYSEGGEEG